MNLKNLALTIAAGSTLLASAPAFADPPHWAPAHGWRAKHHRPQVVHYHRAPAYAYVPARPVYVPVRTVYVPPPVAYYPPPRPVIHAQIPLDHGVRIGVALGL